MDVENEQRTSAELADWELRAWRRLRAGMRVEAGLAPKDSSKRWQEAVKGGELDADLCAEDLCFAELKRPDEERERLLSRSARLQRDLVMAPLLRGAAGASRKARAATRTGFAAVLSQLVVLAIFALLGFLLMLVLAFKGTEFDPFFQSIIDLIPALPSKDS